MKFRFKNFSLIFLFCISFLQAIAQNNVNREELSSTNNCYQLERINPVHFKKNSDGSFFADFGKAAFGTLELRYQTEKKKTIVVRLGEKQKKGRIDQSPGGSIRYQEVRLKLSPGKSRYRIDLKADKRNTKPGAVSLPDTFPVLMPYRYVEVEGIDKFSAESLTQLAYFYKFNDKASAFDCSDSILNQVWNFCKYSIKATSFTGLYIDGDRERIPYEADAYLNQLSHYSVDKEYTMAHKTIEYFMEHPTWPTEWQLHVALMFYQDYMYTGSTELIEKYYVQLKHKTLMALENEDGLISTSSPNHNAVLMQNLGFADTSQRLRDIVDWPKKGGFGGVMGETDDFEYMPVNTVVNSFYYQNMKIMAEFASILGMGEEAGDFKIRAQRTKDAINKRLLNLHKGNYRDGIGTDHSSLHANMLPLAFGIVPEKYTADVVNYMKSRGMACSVYGAQYLLEGLYSAGAADYALELMTATHDRSWYNMIEVGSTISMEAWDMKYKPNADWNHAWAAAPANIIPRGLWGIQPKTPGYDVVSIKPQMGKLENCSLTVPTIKGQIKATYQYLNENNKKYIIELPDTMVGEFSVESPEQVLISINGEKTDHSSGSIKLFPGINDIEVLNEN